jgi:RHS repeat-associated protein
MEDGGFTYQYDNNGNLTRKTPKTPGPFSSYEYDAENRLVRAVINGTTANYKYDGLGRRVEKEVISVGTTVTRHVYDNEDILLELDGSNNIVARYTHGPGIDEPLIMEKGGQSVFYHADGLGSITELTNQSATIVQRYAYSSFGKIESQLDPNFIQPYTFTGREFDPETELYYYRARYYDSGTGRFVSQDKVFNLIGPNRYQYALHNPIRFLDPDGTISLNAICAACLARLVVTQAGAAAAGCAVACAASCYLGECFKDCILSNPLKAGNLESLKAASLVCANVCIFEPLIFPGPEPPEPGPPPPGKQQPPIKKIPKPKGPGPDSEDDDLPLAA